MPKPVNEQINELVAAVIPLGYAAMGGFLIWQGEDLERSGVISESIARVLGWLFVGYGLLKAYFIVRRIRRQREEE